MGGLFGMGVYVRSDINTHPEQTPKSYDRMLAALAANPFSAGVHLP